MEPRESAFWVDLKAKRWLYTLSILATLAVGILIGSVVSYGVKGKEGQQSADAKQLTVPAPQQLSNAFSQIAKQLEPAVVNINTESTIKNPHKQRRGDVRDRAIRTMTARGRPRSNPFDDFFDRFFGGQGGPGGGPGGGEHQGALAGLRRPRGSQGIIITNAHVVEKADRIRVKLQDDLRVFSYDAKVVGTDQETDLAVIKIESDKRVCPPPRWATPTACRLVTGFWPSAVRSDCRRP